MKKWISRDIDYLIVILGSGAMFFGALFYQYALGMEPCFLCIQQRALIFGIFIFSVAGYFFHVKKTGSPTVWRKFLVFCFALITAIFSLYGYDIADAHLANSSQEAFSYLFTSCGTGSPFPALLPLDEWMPSLFGVKTSCDGEIAKAFGVEMPVYVKFFSLLVCVLCCAKLIFAFKGND